MAPGERFTAILSCECTSDLQRCQTTTCVTHGPRLQGATASPTMVMRTSSAWKHFVMRDPQRAFTSLIHCA